MYFRSNNFKSKIPYYKKKATLHVFFSLIFFLFFYGFLILKTEEHTLANITSKKASVTLGLVGDLMFARGIQDIGEVYGYEHVFSYVAPLMQSCDFITGNLESPIVVDCKAALKAPKKIHLSSLPKVAKTLKKMHICCLNLANNHIKDYGRQGLLDTINSLHKNNIQVIGAGLDLHTASKIFYKKLAHLKIACLGFSDILPCSFLATRDRSGVLPLKSTLSSKLVRRAKKNADLVIVHVHWGNEYSKNVTLRQKKLAHSLIDFGADIVLGHHPHTLQQVEFYKKGVIFYSLGNFVFDQPFSFTKETVFVRICFQENKASYLEVYPIFIFKAALES